MTPHLSFGSPPQNRLRWLGLDFGRARTGLAVSDPGRILATPLCVLQTEPQTTLAERLGVALQAARIEQGEIGGIAVGLPIEERGKEGESARWVRDAAARLCDALAASWEREEPIRLAFVDERYTTKVQDRLGRELGFGRKQRQTRIDAWAAVAILQSWIDTQANSRC
jgi:putative holliday junction resolvase